MKTAISIPDELFEAAEKHAAKQRTSRSHLYATALAEYLRRERGKQLTEEMDRALQQIDQTPDPAWESVQIAALKRSEWK